jgi:hypothetical protein
MSRLAAQASSLQRQGNNLQLLGSHLLVEHRFQPTARHLLISSLN